MQQISREVFLDETQKMNQQILNKLAQTPEFNKMIVPKSQIPFGGGLPYPQANSLMPQATLSQNYPQIPRPPVAPPIGNFGGPNF
jgi:hypothetical protein